MNHETLLLSKKDIQSGQLAQDYHQGELSVLVVKEEFSDKDIYGEVGEVVAGKKTGRDNNDKILLKQIAHVEKKNFLTKKTALRTGCGKSRSQDKRRNL